MRSNSTIPRLRTPALRLLCAILVTAALLSLAGCGSGGSATAYDGFVVRTERQRETEAEPASPSRSLSEVTEEEAYILNKSSEKFHYPWCSAVSDIAAKNRWEYHGSRESILEMGYRPCKLCSP